MSPSCESTQLLKFTIKWFVIMHVVYQAGTRPCNVKIQKIFIFAVADMRINLMIDIWPHTSGPQVSTYYMHAMACTLTQDTVLSFKTRVDHLYMETLLIYQLSTLICYPQNSSYCFISKWLYWVIILVWHGQFISILQSSLISSYPSPQGPNIFPNGNGIQFKTSDTIGIWVDLDAAQGAQYLCRPKNLLAQHCPCAKHSWTERQACATYK